MKTGLSAAAACAAVCAVALGGAGAARAGVLTFDDPGPVLIDDTGTLATYTEGGFALSGAAASFLPLDGGLVGGIDGTTPLNLKAVGGGSFSLVSLSHGFYDLGFGAPPGTLTIVGLTNGLQVVSQTLQLGGAATASFGVAFGQLTEVSFSGSTGFALDNLAVTPAVPEPATAAMALVGLLGVAWQLRRRSRPAD